MSSSHVSALLPPDGRNRLGLDCAAFARHYLRYHFCFLFLRVLRCFSSPGSPQLSWCPAFSRAGCPIRVSADHFAFADPRGFSQLITPFVASESLRHPPSALFSFLSICLSPYKETALALCCFTLLSSSTLLSNMSMISYMSRQRAASASSAVENKGLEPLTPCVQGRCSKPTELIPRSA